MAGLSGLLGLIITIFSLSSPCYDGCNVASFFADVIEQFPLSLIILSLLTCAGVLYALALYLFLSIFTTKHPVKRWVYLLLTIAITPILLLALYGLVFDFGDDVIYGHMTLIASGILALVWYPSWRRRTDNFTSHDTLSN